MEAHTGKGKNIYRQMTAIGRLGRQAYAPYKWQIAVLVALGFFGGLLEGIGINAVIPLLTFVLDLHNPATDTISLMLKNVFKAVHIPFVPKFLLLFIVILFIGKACIMFLFSYIQTRISAEYDRATRYKIFSTVFRTSWPHLLTQRLGHLETVLMVDTPQAVALLNKLSFTITIFSSLLMYLIIAFSISALVTAVTFALGILVFIVMRPLMDKVHGISRERAVVYRDTMHHTGEHMGGIKTVKAYGVEADAIARAAKYFVSIKEFSTRVSIIQNIAAQVLAPVGIIYIAGILSLAFKTPFISLAALPAILYLIYRILTYVQQLQNNIQYISEIAPHLERLVQYENTAREETESRGGSEPFTFNRELTFTHVRFAYESGRDVLKDVSFAIEKGTMVGIVGPSGAGKTTCVDIILRLLEPTSGTVTLDGASVKEIGLSEWRRKVAYVSQEYFLLQDTIRNNIRFYDDSISDEEIWDAARMARIDAFIEKSPHGLDTMVGDRGIQLSAGERQRITIARALARKPEVLILDEATSALDNESEAHIKSVIEGLKGHVTIIAIAHRLSTIMDSDTLIVFSEGKVVERGTPKELLANTNSYFYRVYSINQ